MLLVAWAAGDARGQEIEKSSPQPDSSGWVVLPGLNYSPERGLAVAGSVLYYYRTGLGGPDERPSRIATNASISRDKRGQLALDPDLWLFGGKLNLSGATQLSYFDYGYFGIGNDTPVDDREDYTALRAGARAEAVLHIGGPFYGGALYDLRYENVTEVDEGGDLDMGTVSGASGGTLSGIGALARFDTRDNSFQPREGGLVTLSPRRYDGVMGSDSDFTRVVLDASWFFGLGGAHVLALDGRADFRAGDPPFDHLSQAGGGRLLRGMLEGRYRGMHYVASQVEYRFPVWWRLGGVAFAGAGRVANSLDEIDLTGLKFSLGGGVRFAVKPAERINLRFDAATSEGEFNIYFAIAEAF
jgi:outer membrane protein assembly factor BamA